MAIGFKLTKTKKLDLVANSHFFGNPILGLELSKSLIDEDLVFIGQINLNDIKDLDKENILPKEGWLYIFMGTEDDTPYSDKRAVIIHSLERPRVIVNEFNKSSPISEGLNEQYDVEFFEVDDSYDGNKLLGVPSDWNYMDESRPLFLQYDPLDTDGLEFFTYMDGYIYFFFKDENYEIEEIDIQIEYS